MDKLHGLSSFNTILQLLAFLEAYLISTLTKCCNLMCVCGVTVSERKKKFELEENGHIYLNLNKKNSWREKLPP